MWTAASRIAEAAAGIFYPPHCAMCSRDTPAGVHLCGACEGEACRTTAPFCRQCSQPFAGMITAEFTCAQCEERGLHFTCAVAPYRARGVVRELIHRFKYNGQHHLRRPLAAWMMEGFADSRLIDPLIDALVPVPLHSARQRHRQFNQAEELARLLAHPTARPLLHALQRIRYTSTQTRLEREDRIENLRGAFRVRDTAAVRDRHLLLIDDVYTTGSTVEECSRVLRAAGAASVRVLCIARA